MIPSRPIEIPIGACSKTIRNFCSESTACRRPPPGLAHDPPEPCHHQGEQHRADDADRDDVDGLPAQLGDGDRDRGEDDRAADELDPAHREPGRQRPVAPCERDRPSTGQGRPPRRARTRAASPRRPSSVLLAYVLSSAGTTQAPSETKSGANRGREQQPVRDLAPPVGEGEADESAEQQKVEDRIRDRDEARDHVPSIPAPWKASAHAATPTLTVTSAASR